MVRSCLLLVIFLVCMVIISTISSRDVGAGVRLGEVVFGIVEMMFAFYRHQVVVLEFFYHCRGEKMVSITGQASVWWLRVVMHLHGE